MVRKPHNEEVEDGAEGKKREKEGKKIFHKLIHD